MGKDTRCGRAVGDRQLRVLTPVFGGAQFGMAIVPTLELYGTRPTEEGARALAKATHDAWGVGHSDCQSGMMLVLALDDRKVSWTQPYLFTL